MLKEQIRILIACEESQSECIAFRERGFIAFSADLQLCSGGHPEWHIVGDVTAILHDDVIFTTQDGARHVVHHWTLVIAHPPCTYLSMVSASTFKGGIYQHPARLHQMEDAANFFRSFLTINADYIAIENPVPLHAANLPRPTTVVQPYQFGEPWSKRTCLWLVNLPPLMPTIINPNHRSWTWHHAGSKTRSKSFRGISQAMAQQWGEYILQDKRKNKCSECEYYNYVDNEVGFQCDFTFNPPCDV